MLENTTVQMSAEIATLKDYANPSFNTRLELERLTRDKGRLEEENKEISTQFKNLRGRLEVFLIVVLLVPYYAHLYKDRITKKERSRISHS